MKHIIYTLITALIVIEYASAQSVTEENIPVSLLYSTNGAITVSHMTEELEDGFKSSQLRLFMPFSASANQTWSADASLNQLSVLSDGKLESRAGIHWQMHLNRSFSIYSAIQFQHSAYGINKMLNTNFYSDPQSLPQFFSQLGLGASLGIMHTNFWLAGKYNQYFWVESMQQNAAYPKNNLYLSTGLRLLAKNWEFRIPARVENALQFSPEQIFLGGYLAYKDNSLQFITNTLWDLNIELSAMPYRWLRLSAVFQTYQQSAISTYGTSGSYIWKPKKLDL